jgi:hypothetical protein
MAQRRFSATFLWRLVVVSSLLALIVSPVLLFTWSRPVEVWTILGNLSCPGLDKDSAKVFGEYRRAYCHNFSESPGLVVFPLMLAMLGSFVLLAVPFGVWTMTIMTAREEALFIIAIVLGICEYIVWIIFWFFRMQDLIVAFCKFEPPAVATWFTLLLFCVLVILNGLILISIYLQPVSAIGSTKKMCNHVRENIGVFSQVSNELEIKHPGE